MSFLVGWDSFLTDSTNWYSRLLFILKGQPNNNIRKSFGFKKGLDPWLNTDRNSGIREDSRPGQVINFNFRFLTTRGRQTIFTFQTSKWVSLKINELFFIFRFNIMNNEKKDSQFGKGMQPVVYSMKEAIQGRDPPTGPQISNFSRCGTAPRTDRPGCVDPWFKEIQLGDEVEKILFIQKIATKTESVCNYVISIT